MQKAKNPCCVWVCDASHVARPNACTRGNVGMKMRRGKEKASSSNCPKDNWLEYLPCNVCGYLIRCWDRQRKQFRPDSSHACMCQELHTHNDAIPCTCFRLAVARKRGISSSRPAWQCTDHIVGPWEMHRTDYAQVTFVAGELEGFRNLAWSGAWRK